MTWGDGGIAGGYSLFGLKIYGGFKIWNQNLGGVLRKYPKFLVLRANFLLILVGLLGQGY